MPFLGGVFLSLTFVVSALTVAPEPTPQDLWVDKLHQCENPENIVRILDSNDKYSYGYVMFQMDTWLSYGKEFGATKENIGDDDLQRIVAEDMLSKNLWRHWYTCAKWTKKQLGSYPS